MQELEKIIKEIGQAKREPWYRLSNYDVKHKLDGAINRIADIIRENMNDGWIPVEERLPENNKLGLFGQGAPRAERTSGLSAVMIKDSGRSAHMEDRWYFLHSWKWSPGVLFRNRTGRKGAIHDVLQ